MPISVASNVARRLPAWTRLPFACVVANLVLAYVVYAVCRTAFLLENWGQLGQGLTWGAYLKAMWGGLRFDSSAIFYTNAVYIVLLLLPLRFKEGRSWQTGFKWLYVAVNTLAMVINLCDAVYFNYTQKRTTAAVFTEFGNETNLGRIALVEVVNHWYLVLLALGLVALMWTAYRRPRARLLGRKPYYWSQAVALLAIVPVAVTAMRGAPFWEKTRPIGMADAHQYVDDPRRVGIVLNTPFSLMRTMGRLDTDVPDYYTSEAALDAVYTPLHPGAPAGTPQRRRNVVVLIVESFASEFIGALNPGLDNGTYKGYTEFADSLLPHTTRFAETFCNGWVSIDAMPAVLASLPKMFNPFITTVHTQNTFQSLATELGGHWGYDTAFFHGARNSSMGFQAFARQAGFKAYYGRDEYNADKRFGGDADFDGTWGVWDEEFLQFFALKLGEDLQEPFLASVFTLSSHHPFKVPERYAERFVDEGQYPLHKCIRYADNALRRFFDTARRQPWFNNTVFVITADHASSKTTHAEYKTLVGGFRVPLLIYDPSGELPAGELPGMMQHIDIMPTLLGWMGYDRPFVAFGRDALAEDSRQWSFNWNQTPQLFSDGYVLQLNPSAFDAEALYDYRHDPLLTVNLADSMPQRADSMLRFTRAVMQSYQTRMRNDKLTP